MAGYFDNHWYKDKMDVYGIREHKVGNVKKQEFILVKEKIPCKMYRTAQADLGITPTSGELQENNAVAYSNKYYDIIKAGDELIIYQYGDLSEPERYIIGKPKKYKEPFGGVKVGLEHVQASITLKERVINKNITNQI